MKQVTPIDVGSLREGGGQFYYVPVLVEKRAKTLKLMLDEGILLGHKGMTLSLNNLA